MGDSEEVEAEVVGGGALILRAGNRGLEGERLLAGIKDWKALGSEGRLGHCPLPGRWVQTLRTSHSHI